MSRSNTSDNHTLAGKPWGHIFYGTQPQVRRIIIVFILCSVGCQYYSSKKDLFFKIFFKSCIMSSGCMPAELNTLIQVLQKRRTWYVWMLWTEETPHPLSPIFPHLALKQKMQLSTSDSLCLLWMQSACLGGQGAWLSNEHSLLRKGAEVRRAKGVGGLRTPSERIDGLPLSAGPLLRRTLTSQDALL